MMSGNALGSSNNEELVEWEEDKTKAQAASSYVGAPEQQTIAEREIAREAMTTARPGGAERIANEQVIEAEGLGGPNMQGIDVIGDRAEAPDPLVDAGMTVTSGMGGAGGGDLDDLGSQAYPAETREVTRATTIQRPVITEGMGGAGGGDLDDLGSVAYPREDDHAE